MEVQTLNLKIKRHYQKWRHFLEFNGIQHFEPSEVDQIEQTFVWVENQEITATGSVAGKVLKYIAVCSRYSADGALFNQVISQLMQAAAEQGHYHLFVFTKPQYQASFQYVGFRTLAATKDGVLLETGTPGIDDFIKSIPHPQADQQVAVIVMNANPFTLGHRYLVEQASRENDLVYLFIVQAERSFFTFEERWQMVQAGVADLENVKVIASGDYLISAATFPAYFLKDDQDLGTYQASLDITLFKDQFVPALNISRRYVGTEPLSKTTNGYNAVMKRLLPPEVAVIEVERQLDASGQPISATRVRQAIAQADVATLETLLPVSSYRYVKEHLVTLQTRMLQTGRK